MVYTPHSKVKPEVIVNQAVGLLDRVLELPKLFITKGIEEYKGAMDDTINMVVPGVLPAHDYPWRNDRSEPIKMDEYKDRKIAMSFGGRAVSGVPLTDEQKVMDLDGWGLLHNAQTRAVARTVNHGAVTTLRDADYAVILGAREDALAKDVVEARRVLNRLGVPVTRRYLLVGSDIDAIIQLDKQFNTASVAGDPAAATAIQEATVGRWKGFTVVRNEDIAADEAYAFDGSAFAFLNAAPPVPESLKLGGVTKYEGVALRWMRDYDPQYLIERSIMDTWFGFQDVRDPIVYWDKENNREVVSEEEYLVRGIKMKLGGTDVYFDGAAGSDAEKLRKAVGVEGRSNATKHSAGGSGE